METDKLDPILVSPFTKPHLSTLVYPRWWYKNQEDATNMLKLLRLLAGLPEKGPPCEVHVWREDGPNSSPTWTDLELEWGAKTCGELGF